jgi:phosphoribosyl 1,2-cyclic phosphate phosphodiesterase
MSFQVTILGCGSSAGVPRVGTGWGACDPTNPKNRRRRCSILVEKTGGGGTTSVLIDTSPDLREQLLMVGQERLDAVLFTHDHADHTHGIDDLRPLVGLMHRRIPVYADDGTRPVLAQRFGYCFAAPPGSGYPPILELRSLQAGVSVVIDGPGGAIAGVPFRLIHGPSDALGFRFGDLAYAPDVNAIPTESTRYLEGLDILIIDALRYTPHPTHFSVSEALEVIERFRPKRAILTNLHTDLDYAQLTGQLPPNVEAAYDGMGVPMSLAYPALQSQAAQR